MERRQHDQTLTEVFKQMSDQPESIDEHTFNILCSFIYTVYGINASENSSFKTLRTNQLVNTPDPNLRALVPSPSGILQQIKRACYQAGYLWRLCEFELDLPDPVEWGWKPDEENVFVPRWQDEDAVDMLSLLKTCSCSKGKCSNCSCKKANMKCLRFCKCDKQNCAN